LFFRIFALFIQYRNLFFTAPRLDVTRSAQSGVDAEFRQNHELQKQPNGGKSDYPIKFIHGFNFPKIY